MLYSWVSVSVARWISLEVQGDGESCSDLEEVINKLETAVNLVDIMDGTYLSKFPSYILSSGDW